MENKQNFAKYEETFKTCPILKQAEHFFFLKIKSTLKKLIERTYSDTQKDILAFGPQSPYRSVPW